MQEKTATHASVIFPFTPLVSAATGVVGMSCKMSIVQAPGVKNLTCKLFFNEKCHHAK